MRVLVIDDEIAALTKMNVLLSAYGDCTMVANGLQALQQCAKAIQNGKAFDLITIDIQLPEVNGLDLLAAINKLETSRNAPASKKIMVTASGTKDNLFKATIKGCDGFLVKPVKRDTIETKMAAMGFAKKATDPAARDQ